MATNSTPWSIFVIITLRNSKSFWPENNESFSILSLLFLVPAETEGVVA